MERLIKLIKKKTFPCLSCRVYRRLGRLHWRRLGCSNVGLPQGLLFEGVAKKGGDTRIPSAKTFVTPNSEIHLNFNFRRYIFRDIV